MAISGIRMLMALSLGVRGLAAIRLVPASLATRRPEGQERARRRGPDIERCGLRDGAVERPGAGRPACSRVGPGVASGRCAEWSARSPGLGAGEHIERIKSQAPHGIVTIVVPEFAPGQLWQHALHNWSAFLVKGAMLFRRGIVVNVPFHLKA
jgi:hypothetical protein